MNDLYQFGDLYDRMVDDYKLDIPFYVEEALQAEPPVLELACGTGRVLIPIAQAGVKIWGLDVTPAMLEHAVNKVAALPAELQQRVTLRSGDMRDFDLPERFGLVIIPFRSFLHLMTVEDQLATLDNIHRHLKPGGRLALNFFQPDLALIAAHMAPTGRALKYLKEWDDPQSGGRVVVWETRRYDTFNQIINEQRVIEVLDSDGRVVDRYYRPLTLRWIYRTEFEHLLARTGFRVAALYGDLDRSPISSDSSELVWIAEKVD